MWSDAGHSHGTAKKLLQRTGGRIEMHGGRWAFLSRPNGLVIYIDGNCSYFHAGLQAGVFQKPNKYSLGSD